MNLVTLGIMDLVLQQKVLIRKGLEERRMDCLHSQGNRLIGVTCQSFLLSRRGKVRSRFSLLLLSMKQYSLRCDEPFLQQTLLASL